MIHSVFIYKITVFYSRSQTELFLLINMDSTF